jgi:hypothetical protein
MGWVMGQTILNGKCDGYGVTKDLEWALITHPHSCKLYQ